MDGIADSGAHVGVHQRGQRFSGLERKSLLMGFSSCSKSSFCGSDALVEIENQTSKSWKPETGRGSGFLNVLVYQMKSWWIVVLYACSDNEN
jgi:hypothetical protein